MDNHQAVVERSLPRCTRILILVSTVKKPMDLAYEYQKGARGLRA
ncbi:MAG: chorismate mutase [Chloroflexi bacterium]|nr:chorismate mutase [Chloroflexota bacterium]